MAPRVWSGGGGGRAEGVNVELICVGTELLLGQIVNTNAAVIGSRLAEAGLDHYRQAVVGDNLERLAEAVSTAMGRAEAVIISGGLGPTQDDITRQAIARATGRELSFREEWAEELRRRAAASGREMPEANLRQAECPEGAELIPNPKGSAPGLDLKTERCRIFALPGVPEELRAMLDAHVIPALAGTEDGALVSRILRTWGHSEARVDELLDDLYRDSVNPTVAFLASSGEIQVRLTARASVTEEAEALIEPLEEEVRRRLGSTVFGRDEESGESVLLGLLAERGWRLAVAESATGGLVAARLTEISGASKVFAGGVVAYSAESKEDLLGVPAEILAEGLVTEPVAAAMASGAADRFGVEVGLGVTGSAGPEPLEQPVGTMVIAVATPDGTRSRRMTFPGDRERVRAYASTAAVHLARLAVLGEPWER